MAVEIPAGSESESHAGQGTPGSPESSRAAGAGYEIRFQDHLDPCWLEWFEGWTITNLDNGVVCLSSPRVDQSALHGALNKIRDLNLTLISVTRL
jgi:hypothetical protein